MARKTLVIHRSELGVIVGIYLDDPDGVVCVEINDGAEDTADDSRVGELFTSPLAQLRDDFDGDMLARVNGLITDANGEAI